MANPISREVEDIGVLKSVVGVFALPPEDRGTGVRFDKYVLGFEASSIVISAEPKDDSIRVHFGDASHSFEEDLTAREPWRTLIGCSVLWTWTLTNQHGYQDGFQIELARPGECWAIQFMSEGAALSVRSIGPVERLWNQFEKDQP